MRCAYCGSENNQNAMFCFRCGKPLTMNNMVPRILLRCRVCNHMMEVENNGQPVVCPCCGSRDLIQEFPTAQAPQMGNPAYQNVNLNRMQNENAWWEKQEIKNRQVAYQKGAFSKVTIVFVFICLLSCILCFVGGRILSGLIAAAQTGLFSCSWLMGMQIIKEKKLSLHKVFAIASFLLIIPFFVLAGRKIDTRPKMEWPQSGMVDLIPDPKAKRGDIKYNNEEHFSAEVYNYSEEDYRLYIEKCKENGFTIDSDETQTKYDAFNEEGYQLNLFYRSSSKEMVINLYAPMQMKQIRWPSSGMGAMLPIPASLMGKVNVDSMKEFAVYIGDTSEDDFNDYIDACIEQGFNEDYSRYEFQYSADDEEGYHLDIILQGFSIMYVSITAPQITTPEETESGNQSLADESSFGDSSDAEMSSSELSDESSSDSEQLTDQENTESSHENENDEELSGESSQESESSEEISDESSQEEESSNEQQGESEQDGIDPDLIDFLESYEAFIDEYVAFMEKYQNEENPLSLMVQYAAMMGRYAEMSAKLDQYDPSEMSLEEAWYYYEVINRCNQKLSSVLDD